MTISLVKAVEEKEGILFCLFEDNKKIFKRVPFFSYFYVKEVDFLSYEQEFKRDWGRLTNFSMHEANNCDANGKMKVNYMRIIMKNNFMRQKIRSWWEDRACKTFEADIKADKRFMILNKDKTPCNADKMNYLSFDIETDDRSILKKDNKGVVIATTPVLTFSAVDQDGNTFQYANEGDEPADGEKALLEKISALMNQYCIGFGWNSSMFDFPYLKQRMQVRGVGCGWEHINELDYLEIFKKNFRHSLPSYKLNDVATEILEDKKLDQPKGNGKVYKAWKENRAFLLEYNLKDAQLVMDINKKMDFLQIHMNVANIAHCFIQQTMNESPALDPMIMTRYHEKNIVMPSTPNAREQLENEKKGSIGGGYTTCLKPGLHKKVDVWDMKSEYPTMIETFNISPETLLDHPTQDAIHTPDDTNDDAGGVRYHPIRYFARHKGVFPEIIRELVDERDKTKYTMKQFKKSDPEKYRALYLYQYGLKVLANSMYGVLSYSKSRYYRYDIGDAVTTCARALIKGCYVMLEQRGCVVLGGDTDSVFVVLPEGVTYEKVDQEFIKFFDDWVKKFNIDKHCIVFEHEKQFTPMFFVMKKNYAYVDESEKTEKNPSGIIIKGLECMKADANKLAAQLQKRFVIDVISYAVNKNVWMKFVYYEHKRCMSFNMTVEELTMSKALTKHPAEYAGYTIDKKTGQPKIKKDGTIQTKSIPAHVKLAERLMAEGNELTIGSKIAFIVVESGPLQVITPEQYTGVYEAKYYWERVIRPLLKVMNAYDKAMIQELINAQREYQADAKMAIISKKILKKITESGEEEIDD